MNVQYTTKIRNPSNVQKINQTSCRTSISCLSRMPKLRHVIIKVLIQPIYFLIHISSGIRRQFLREGINRTTINFAFFLNSGLINQIRLHRAVEDDWILRKNALFTSSISIRLGEYFYINSNTVTKIYLWRGNISSSFNFH